MDVNHNHKGASDCKIERKASQGRARTDETWDDCSAEDELRRDRVLTNNALILIGPYIYPSIHHSPPTISDSDAGA